MTESFDRKTDRRRFLRGALGVGGGLAVLGAGCLDSNPRELAPDAQPGPTTSPMPAEDPNALPEGLDPSKFWVHGRTPLTLETKRSSFGRSAITPISVFFVRNNLPMPDRSITHDPDAWMLEVTGVKQPRKISVAQLKQLATETIAAVVQCSGNGRKFFDHAASGSQWATGAAGCAMWTGIRVKDLIEQLGGPVDGTRYLTSTGGEELPEGVDPLGVVVERSIPLEKGLDDCMLVWEMNGVPIPITHGGPLRLIVPGYFGCNQIKYIKRLACTAAETEAKIQKSGYRFRPIGEKGAPSQPSMWRMNVKSWVNGPGADDEPVLRGKVQFYGVALSGERTIEKVEVTLDGGKTWGDARFTGPDLGPSAWRAFTFEAELDVGQHTVATRATDSEGDVQPERRVENERGYSANGWTEHALAVRVVDKLPKKEPPAATTTAAGGGAAKAKDSARLSADGAQGKTLVQSTAQPPCGACHTVGDAGLLGTVGPNLDELKPDEQKIINAVTNGVGAMPPYRGTLSAEQIKLVAKYLVEASK